MNQRAHTHTGTHTDTHTRAHMQTQTHKLNGKRNLTLLRSVSVSTLPRWRSLAVLLDYQCSGVMGLARQDKTNPDEMNHVGAERAALCWWKKPRHSERWDCNSGVLPWVTWLTAWSPARSLQRRQRIYRYTTLEVFGGQNKSFNKTIIRILISFKINCIDRYTSHFYAHFTYIF